MAASMAASIAALGLGCSEPGSATGSTESRLPTRASAQLAGSGQAGPVGQVGPGSRLPADPARAARQQDQLSRFAASTGRGGLLLRSDHWDDLVPGPILSTDIEIRVSGPIARVSVRQRFQNPSREWVEGLYVFPLPGDAAVDHMRVITASQTLEGEIQEKEQAVRTYTQARAEGKQAGLVQWQRPNLFTTAVANLEPGGEVTVEIEYQQSLAPDSGVWSLRFPLARLSPDAPPPSPPPSASTIASSSSTASTTTSSVTTPAAPVHLAVDLAPGFGIFPPVSLHHAVRHLGPAPGAGPGGGHRVELNAAGADDLRDFVLRWKPLPGARPEASLFQESWGGRHQSLLVLAPPHPVGPPPPAPPREILFVVDVSGSMAGTSIEQARLALEAGIETLAPEDRFNVLAFSDSVRALFTRPQRLGTDTRREALDFIGALEAYGGTSMEPALEAALRRHPGQGGRVRQVVFITDGAILDPDGLHGRIQDWAGESRLFMVGIGSAPNAQFMRKAAGYGRGTYTAIGDPAQAGAIIRGLFEKIGGVVLSEIEIELPAGVQAEVQPARIGDLYRGEPLVVVIESDQPLAWVGVRGQAGDSPWSLTLDARDFEDRPGVHVLWARKKIGALLDEIRMSGDTGGARSKAVTSLALEHHLVSPYTSLVAVEKIARRRDHEPWVQKATLGSVASSAPPALAVNFAQGATPAAGQLALGASSLVAAGALAWAGRRRS